MLFKGIVAYFRSCFAFRSVVGIGNSVFFSLEIIKIILITVSTVKDREEEENIPQSRKL